MAVDPKIKKKADDIRNKIYGKEVRESLASGLEAMSTDVVENEGRQSVVEGRQDSVESQWQSVIDETTGKDVISAPEIIAARDGEANLKARLDKENQEVTAQLAQTNVRPVAGISLKENGNNRGILTVITDDSFQADWRYMLPLSQELGVPFCTAVITDRLNAPDSTTVEQLLTLQNEHGWEILSHTKTHSRLGDLSRSEQDYELRRSKEILQSHGLKVENIAYPFGSYNKDTLDLVRKYYRSGRSTDYGLHGFNLPPLDTFVLKTLWMDSNAIIPNDPSGLQVNTAEYYKWYIDRAVEKKGWITILLHSNWTEHDDYGPMLAEVVEYAKGKLDILTVSQALDRFGNIVDTGNKIETSPYQPHFAVGYNGDVHTNSLKEILAETNAFTSANHIDDFETYSVTTNRINTTKAVELGMPDGTGGILKTYKLVDKYSQSQVYNYQEYLTLYDNNLYVRFANNDKTWGDFHLSNSKLNMTQGFTCDTPITLFKTGITTTTINTTTASTTGSPEGLGGTLLTYKMHKTSHGYNWQEYVIYDTNKTYRRYFKSDGTATAWVSKNIVTTMATPWTAIPAGETVDVTIADDNMKSSNVANVNPQGTIPTGIIWEPIAKDGSLTIRVISVRTDDTALDAMNWRVNVV